MENDRLIKVTRYMSGKSICDYFDGAVAYITIKAHTTFESIAGTKEETRNIKLTQRDVADFYVKCPNKECTEVYIDLRSIVGAMVAKRQVTSSGVTTCCGRIAPDHPNQSCDSRTEYDIEIRYTQH